MSNPARHEDDYPNNREAQILGVTIRLADGQLIELGDEFGRPVHRVAATHDGRVLRIEFRESDGTEAVLVYADKSWFSYMLEWRNT